MLRAAASGSKRGARQSRVVQRRGGRPAHVGIEAARFLDELRAVGLAPSPCAADGNCLFRAVAHQLCADEREHPAIREACCRALRAEPDMYAPFLLEEEGHGDMESYTAAMAVDAEWGGNVELIAIARVFGVDICIHQQGEVPWLVAGRQRAPVPAAGADTADSDAASTLHISYHSGDHYSSVVPVDGVDSSAVQPLLRDSSGIYRVAGPQAAVLRAKLFATGLASSTLSPAVPPTSVGATRTRGASDATPDNEELETAEPPRTLVAASTAPVKAAVAPRRNGACACGSGRVYRRCCGAAAGARRRGGVATAAADVQVAGAALGALHI